MILPRQISLAGALAAALLLISASNGHADDTLSKLVARAPSQQVGIAVVDAVTGERLFSHQSKSLLKPASVLKVVTSGAALEYLGSHFRFRTEVFLAGRRNAAVERLTIVGGGDPSLTIESAWLLARKVKLLGIGSIRELVIDDGAFPEARRPTGQRAYETGASALSFNFNSIAVSVCPSNPGSPAHVLNDPWEMPVKLLGTINTTGRGGGTLSIDEISGPGSAEVKFRVQGSIRAGESCRTVYRSISDPPRYFGTVFVELLRSLGISVGKTNVTHQLTGEGQRGPRVLVHESKELSLIIGDLNHFSTNFIAEQILHALGASSQGEMNRDEGLARLRTYIRTLGIDDAAIFDASGLTHENRISAEAITRVLTRLANDTRAGPEFISSLSVSGESGTLRDRTFGRAADPLFVRAKTGSLDGVSSLAGYLTSQSGRKIAFAILSNQVSSKEKASQFEEDLLAAIARVL